MSQWQGLYHRARVLQTFTSCLVIILLHLKAQRVWVV